MSNHENEAGFADLASDKLQGLSDPSAAPAVERRAAPRSNYRVVGTLETVGTGDAHRDVRVMTRDADPAGTGFVAEGETLPAGRRAVLHVPGPDGQTRRIECHVRRSSAVAGNPGWFEGHVEFTGEQPVFSDKRIRFHSKRPRPRAAAGR
jgi:hypothetical protein